MKDMRFPSREHTTATAAATVAVTAGVITITRTATVTVEKLMEVPQVQYIDVVKQVAKPQMKQVARPISKPVTEVTYPPNTTTTKKPTLGAEIDGAPLRTVAPAVAVAAAVFSAFVLAVSVE